MNQRERDTLLEAAALAYRELDRDGRVKPPPAWSDLAPEAREELFRLQVATREIERAARGISHTVETVIIRIRRRGW